MSITLNGNMDLLTELYKEADHNYLSRCFNITYFLPDKVKIQGSFYNIYINMWEQDKTIRYLVDIKFRQPVALLDAKTIIKFAEDVELTIRNKEFFKIID
jgi:hypothetical protein